MGGKKLPDKSKKSLNKEKEKIIEDKTFGLKNKKKSAAVQKYIKGVAQQVKGVPKGGERALIASELQGKEEKKKTLADSALLASLFKSVVELPKGGDTKLAICSFYKQGMCTKGDKCKFSHDLSGQPVKQEKFDLYSDPRPYVQNNLITCEFFMDAVKSDKIGFFWKCQNGDECIYRHALPEGYELNKEEVKIEDDEDEKPSLEETLDKERSELPLGMQPIKFEEFKAWMDEDRRQRDFDIMESKKHLKGVSGRALFESNQALFQDDEDAVEDYQRDEAVEIEEEEEEEEKEHKDNRLESEVIEEKKEEENPDEPKEENPDEPKEENKETTEEKVDKPQDHELVQDPVAEIKDSDPKQ